VKPEPYTKKRTKLATEHRKTQSVRHSFLDDTIKDRMRKNSVWNMMFFVLTFPLMFVITPMILKTVGAEAYGVWALTGTILVFIELFGAVQTPSALSVLVPSYDAKKDSRDINELVNTMFFFFAATAAVMAAAYFLLEPVIISAFFKVSPEMTGTVKFVLGFSVYAFLINFVMMGFGYLLGGFNVFYILSIMHTVAAYVRFTLMAVALLAGYGIKGVVAAQMGVLLVESAVTLFYAKAVYPPLKFGIGYFSAEKLKKLLSLSLKLFMTRAASLVNQNIDKLSLGFFLNPVMAAFYQIGASVSKYITQVPEMMGLYSLMPAVSELKTRGMTEKIGIMFRKTNKYMFFIALPLMAGIMALGGEFIFLWLGAGYENAYLVMVVLAAGYTTGLLGHVPMNVLNGMQKMKETMAISGFSALLNIALSVILTWKLGLKGALAGTTVSITVSAVMFYTAYRKIMGHGMDISSAILKPLLSCALAAAAVYMAARAGFYGTWPALLAKSALFAALYLGTSIWVLRHFDAYDIELVSGYFRKGKKP